MWSGVRCAVQKRKLSHPSLAQILEDCRASTGALKAACQQSVLKSQVRSSEVKCEAGRQR
jgi:hypothetical protein